MISAGGLNVNPCCYFVIYQLEEREEAVGADTFPTPTSAFSLSHTLTLPARTQRPRRTGNREASVLEEMMSGARA